jgi:drug/metabolite transporter (DMT)-like permease
MTSRDRRLVLGARSGEALAALAAAAYGSAYVATSFALRSFEPLPAGVWRSGLAALALAVAMVAAPRDAGSGAVPGRVAREPGSAAAEPSGLARGARLVVLGGLAGPVFLGAMNLAVADVGATIAAFVAGLYAVLSAVIAPALLPERLAPRTLVGFGAALAGTALLAELDPGASDLVGIGWGLLAAVSFALFLVLTRRWSSAYRLDGRAIALTTVVATAIVLGAVTLATDAGPLVPAAPRIDALVATIWLAVVAVLGQLLTIASVRIIPAQRSAAFLLLNPITATVLAAILLGERPSPIQLLGGILVLVGIALATGALSASAIRRRLVAQEQPSP